MLPEGNLPELLDLEKHPKTYGTGEWPDNARFPRSGSLREQLREELRKFTTTEPGELDHDRDRVLELARILHYYVPVYNAASLSGRSRYHEQKVTPERAVKIALYYVMACNRQVETADSLEDEIIHRFLRHIRYLLRKTARDRIDDLEGRIEQTRRKLERLTKREKKLDRLYSGTNSLSFTEQIRRWFRFNEIKREYADVERRRNRIEEKLNLLNALNNLDKRFQTLRKWIEVRDKKHTKALDYDEFVSSYDYLTQPEEEERTISDLRPSELKEMMQNAVEFLAGGLQQTIEVTHESSPEVHLPEGEQPEEQQQQTVPPYLELKDNYSNTEIQDVFQAINSGDVDLGEHHSRIRTMLLSGNPRGAIEEIRKVIGIDE